MFGKHTCEDYTNRQLSKIIKGRDREIEEIKTECANEFKKIADLCFCNEYGDKLDKFKKLSNIHEIARSNFSALAIDLVIDGVKNDCKKFGE